MDRNASHGFRRYPSQAVTSIAILTLVCFEHSVTWTQATATLAGSVNDSQGAIVPGAAVTVTSETRGLLSPL